MAAHNAMHSWLLIKCLSLGQKTRYETYSMLLRAKQRCGGDDLSVFESMLLEEGALQRAQSSPTLQDSSLTCSTRDGPSPSQTNTACGPHEPNNGCSRGQGQRHSYRQAVRKWTRGKLALPERKWGLSLSCVRPPALCHQEVVLILTESDSVIGWWVGDVTTQGAMESGRENVFLGGNYEMHKMFLCLLVLGFFCDFSPFIAHYLGLACLNIFKTI